MVRFDFSMFSKGETNYLFDQVRDRIPDNEYIDTDITRQYSADEVVQLDYDEQILSIDDDFYDETDVENLTHPIRQEMASVISERRSDIDLEYSRGYIDHKPYDPSVSPTDFEEKEEETETSMNSSSGLSR